MHRRPAQLTVALISSWWLLVAFILGVAVAGVSGNDVAGLVTSVIAVYFGWLVRRHATQRGLDEASDDDG